MTDFFTAVPDLSDACNECFMIHGSSRATSAFVLELRIRSTNVVITIAVQIVRFGIENSSELAWSVCYRNVMLREFGVVSISVLFWIPFRWRFTCRFP